MMLADMGAEVIRVDRGPGRPWPGAGRRRAGDVLAPRPALHRRRPQAPRRRGDRCCASSSRPTPCIEGFRPGVMERLGLGPDVCLARNPKLVFGRMTGWGQDGPYAPCGRPRHQLHRAGRARSPTSAAPASRPIPPLNLVGDFGGGGMLLAFGVVCALLEAQRSGAGPGGRRGHGRRRRRADDHVLGRCAGRASFDEDEPRHEPARHRRPLLRRRTSAPTASTSRSGRSSRSSTPSCCASPGSTDDPSSR